MVLQEELGVWILHLLAQEYMVREVVAMHTPLLFRQVLVVLVSNGIVRTVLAVVAVVAAFLSRVRKAGCMVAVVVAAAGSAVPKAVLLRGSVELRVRKVS